MSLVEHGDVDLAAVHGMTELRVGQVFVRVVLASQFIDAYCFNQNKQIKHDPKSGGKLSKYKCSDESCGWEVRVCRTDMESSAKAFYVSFFKTNIQICVPP